MLFFQPQVVSVLPNLRNVMNRENSKHQIFAFLISIYVHPTSPIDARTTFYVFVIPM